ncbi:hypothetical protein CR105_04600 [Massilia eurypsychrophila]|jgi:hypothetical protein|uniref:Uncharacterized protein n=1 Tax=Massilia eurypsychrophila TaxID=1485217 RepID=A0A2G8TL54_9BURK|nr:hypothetical protein [Massilia eurypsychrophila]PIL46358.1 hypothetical protein CR105_04600 [Massilia eurypsychrophila]
MTKLKRLKQLTILAVLASAATLANAESTSNKAQKIAGVYSLQGQREMAATLVLHPDKRFEFGAIYGGADPRANGKWSVEDDIVHLVADHSPAKYVKVEQSMAPLPDIRDSSGILPVLAVEIGSPSLRMTWSGLNVTFKFANGRERTGTTSRSGMVYAGARQDPEWKDVPVIEVGLPALEEGGEVTWIKLKDPTITKIAVELDPGGTTQAFREGFLEIEKGKPRRLVAGRLMGELRGTYVWNRPVKSQ